MLSTLHANSTVASLNFNSTRGRSNNVTDGFNISTPAYINAFGKIELLFNIVVTFLLATIFTTCILFIPSASARSLCHLLFLIKSVLALIRLTVSIIVWAFSMSSDLNVRNLSYNPIKTSLCRHNNDEQFDQKLKRNLNENQSYHLKLFQ